MLAIISPAKKLDFESDPITDVFTEPVLIKDTKKLAKQAKNLTRADLRRRPVRLLGYPGYRRD